MNDTPKVVRVEPKARPRRDNDGLHKRRGIWHYKLKIQGRWREYSTGTRNYQDARKKRQQALQAQEEGRLPSDAAKAKLEQAAPKWLEDRRKLVAPQTWRIDKERLKPLLKALGHQRLCDITNEDIRAYQLQRCSQVGNRTVNLETKVLRQILKQHRLWARLADDYKPLKENREGPGRALTPNQEKALFSVARGNPRWEAAYYAALIASNTTARACELKGLRLQDVDLMESIMRIRRGSTKTDAGCRVVPLNQTALWAVSRLYERAKKLGATEPGHYLFPACEGGRIDVARPQKTWRTAWRKLVRESARQLGREAAKQMLDSGKGLRSAIAAWKSAATPIRGLRFHDLRHHCITKLAEAGVPEQTLMSIAGHVNKAMLEHYSHIRMQAKKDAVQALDTLKPAEATPKANQPIN